MNVFQKTSGQHQKPAGLRERNRETRHCRILESSASQFRERGYDNVKIDEIAEAAEVSVGTIYNYHQNKGDILVALVGLEVHEVLSIGEKVVANPPDDPEIAISRLICTYLDHSLTYLSKEMWRQAMAISTMQPVSPAGSTYTELDVALKDQVIRMVENLIAMKRLRAGVDAKALGSILFHAQNDMFINFVKDDSQTMLALKKAIRRNNKALVGLISV
jgi:AcrR family transcriptional regulator